MSELQSQTTSTAERSKMMEILRRLREEENIGQELEEGEDPGNMEERLAGLDLDAEDPDVVWQRLTKSEQVQFQKAVSSGHLASLLPVHTPWWQLRKPAVVIDEAVGADHENLFPDLLPDLPPLHTLVKGGKVSPIVRYNILNVLYAYAYTVRLYNGEHHDLAVEAAQTVLDISRCLSDNASFSLAGDALTHAVTTVQQTQHLASNAEMVFSVMKDVSCILCSPGPSSCCSAPLALSDLHRMLSTASSHLHSQRGFTKERKRSVKMANKKVYFLTVWASENREDLQCLAKVVDIEYETSVASWRTHTEHSHPHDHNRLSSSNPKLITDIS
jgi:hypothetical protein